MKRLRLILAILSAAWLASVPVFGERISTDLSAGWKFIRQDAGLAAPTDSWESVSVPHTWNALDGQKGKVGNPSLPDGYYRGACWYAHALTFPADEKGKRLFVRFEAASIVAQVYFNGHFLGEHRGAFNAFCYELTPYIDFNGSNELRVRVDNSRFDDVPPLSGDFNMDGGLYRPVSLIVTPAIGISPLDYASPGVYITPTQIGDADAVVEVRTLATNGASAPVPAQVETEILDAGLHPVASQKSAVELAANETKPVAQTLRIPHPHRWNGRADPYLYSVIVRVSGAGHEADEVTQPLGLRTVAIANAGGFLLNGKPYPIHGVDCHQDRWNQGWALSPANHAEDMKFICDMGATAIRFTHYPQSECVHDLCDRNGLLLWNEIPLVNKVTGTPAFKNNARLQLREMILQRYNHPSAVFWGLFNELDKKLDPIETPMLEQLKQDARELDPERLTVAASNRPKTQFDKVPDWVCFNAYPGWYSGQPTDLTKFIDDRYQELGGRPFALSEYGAGANPFQHEEEPLTRPDPKGQFHPEEWQSYFHEVYWGQIKDNPKLWGSFIWVMFDLPSARRNEGGMPGFNDKGLVTADRQTKKDAYFFYQANWSQTPMVYITSRRLTPRRQPITEIKVYSNCPRVELKLNGRSLGTVVPDGLHICRWEKVRLQPGQNHIEAGWPGSQVTDACGWIMESKG
ncbi:MAG TPA: glycoside hydrolase family 2 TIM barrel-domain containing protein [Candidatus Methylacidiphilales bacterium]|nr:glycoside hydrolase family 2 TIM barrel-domain containing protein [Candidatus Methylacidiphilales bacterium]